MVANAYTRAAVWPIGSLRAVVDRFASPWQFGSPRLARFAGRISSLRAVDGLRFALAFRIASQCVGKSGRLAWHFDSPRLGRGRSPDQPVPAKRSVPRRAEPADRPRRPQVYSRQWPRGQPGVFAPTRGGGM